MSTSTITRKFFDYNSLPDNATRATLRSEAQAIKLAVKRTHDNIIEIGNRLIHAKEVAGHGQFLNWIDAEFGMSDRHARNFMNVAEAFANRNNCSDLPLSQSAIFALSSPSISEDLRDIIIQEVEAGNVKTKSDVREWATLEQPTSLPQIPTTVVISKSEEEDDLGPDPFAEEPDESLAGIAEIDAEDDEPIVDVPEPEGDYFTDEPPAPAPKADTLKDRVKNAEVVHDTLKSSAPKAEEEMDTQELFESLPINRVLREKGHKAIFLQRDLRGYYSIMEAKKVFDHHARRAYDVKNADTTMFAKTLAAWVSLPHPRDWQVCAPCRGNGCQRCGFAGYDTTGAGISPLRVESGEVEL